MHSLYESVYVRACWCRAIKLGDQTMSVLEIWGAEYQENNALLIKPEARDLLEEVCRRERCNMQVSPSLSSCSHCSSCFTSTGQAVVLISSGRCLVGIGVCQSEPMSSSRATHRWAAESLCVHTALQWGVVQHMHPCVGRLLEGKPGFTTPA